MCQNERVAVSSNTSQPSTVVIECMGTLFMEVSSLLYYKNGSKNMHLMLQRRGGRGKTGGKLRENDAISNVLTVMSHDHLVCIATDGSCHTVRAFDVPERSRTARGMPMGELLPKLKSGVTVAAVVPLRSSGDHESHVMLLTVMGKAKRIDLQQLRCELCAGVVLVYSANKQTTESIFLCHAQPTCGYVCVCVLPPRITSIISASL